MRLACSLSAARVRRVPVASALPLASGALGRPAAAVAWAATRVTRYADRIKLYSPPELLRVSVTATQAVSPAPGAASSRGAVTHFLTSVVRENCTLRSVGAG